MVRDEESYDETACQSDDPRVPQDGDGGVDEIFGEHERHRVLISEEILLSEVKVHESNRAYRNRYRCERTIETGQPNCVDDVGVLDGKLDLWPLEKFVSLLLTVLKTALSEEPAPNAGGKFGQNQNNVGCCWYHSVDYHKQKYFLGLISGKVKIVN